MPPHLSSRSWSPQIAVTPDHHLPHLCLLQHTGLKYLSSAPKDMELSAQDVHRPSLSVPTKAALSCPTLSPGPWLSLATGRVDTLTAFHPSPDGFIPSPRAKQPHSVGVKCSQGRGEWRTSLLCCSLLLGQYRPLLLPGTSSHYDHVSQSPSWGLLGGTLPWVLHKVAAPASLLCTHGPLLSHLCICSAPGRSGLTAEPSAWKTPLP